MKWFKQNWLWLVVNLVAILPLIMILNSFSVNLTTDGLPQITVEQPVFPEREFEDEAGGVGLAREDDVSKERSPLKFQIHTTGEWAIRWLVFSLTCTPLYILFGWRPALTIKKALGLYAFMYAVLHLLFFAAGRGWLAVFDEFNFILGLLSLLLMLPLALTSNQWSMRGLGKIWKVMHRLVYAAGLLAVLHVVFLGKGLWLPYAILLAIGFAVRIPQARRSITDLRRRIFRHSPMPA